MFDSLNISRVLVSGALSAAVPGEIKGYWEAKQRYGNPDISWGSLIQPSIDMARNGIEQSDSAYGGLIQFKDAVLADPGMV